MMRDWRKSLKVNKTYNPGWFPSHPHFYDGESRLFFGTWITQKQAETFPIGEGPKTNRDKRTDGKGFGQKKRINMKYRIM